MTAGSAEFLFLSSFLRFCFFASGRARGRLRPGPGVVTWAEGRCPFQGLLTASGWSALPAPPRPRGHWAEASGASGHAYVGPRAQDAFHPGLCALQLRGAGGRGSWVWGCVPLSRPGSRRPAKPAQPELGVERVWGRLGCSLRGQVVPSGDGLGLGTAQPPPNALKAAWEGPSATRACGEDAALTRSPPFSLNQEALFF